MQIKKSGRFLFIFICVLSIIVVGNKACASSGLILDDFEDGSVDASAYYLGQGSDTSTWSVSADIAHSGSTSLKYDANDGIPRSVFYTDSQHSFPRGSKLTVKYYVDGVTDLTSGSGGMKAGLKFGAADNNNKYSVSLAPRGDQEIFEIKKTTSGNGTTLASKSLTAGEVPTDV